MSDDVISFLSDVSSSGLPSWFVEVYCGDRKLASYWWSRSDPSFWPLLELEQMTLPLALPSDS